MCRSRDGHRVFAAFYDALTGLEPSSMKAIRAEVAGKATGRVLEVGAGSGRNFEFYADGVDLVVAEPDVAMLGRARRRARDVGRRVSFFRAPAESLPFLDASFDTVVCSLVLCSVTSQAEALAEVRRVLKPDGMLRFLEHVRGRGAEGVLWDLVTPLWRRFAAGCHPNRRTERALVAAGFEIVALRWERLPDALPAIVGVALPR
jgi:ubiquinone/menaquinone biosynthesis C-methylase UbiE